MIPILTVAQVRAADAQAMEQVPQSTLVARAGSAVAFAARRLMGGCYGRRVLVLAGPGSNGADGRVAAELLSRWGAKVEVVDLAAAPVEVGEVDLFIDAALGTGLGRPFEAPAVAAGVAVLAVDLPSGIDADSGDVHGHPARGERPRSGPLAGSGGPQVEPRGWRGRRLAGNGGRRGALRSRCHACGCHRGTGRLH